MYAVSKLNKQHEQTWINLQKRLNSPHFPYQQLFPNQGVYRFVKNKAISVGSCEGYFIPSLLTTTAFILACDNTQVNITTHKQPLNIFTIFVGYPGTGKFNWKLFFIFKFTSGITFFSGRLLSLSVQSKRKRADFRLQYDMLLFPHTGKSSAIQYAAQDPLENLDFTDAIISKTTSSGLVKLIANKKKGIILSPEVFDIINKLLKSDEDNATGDVQLLCKLFLGERCSYHFSTEETRVIPPNTPFCLLGSTQLVNAAKLIARMDQGHGLVDRILVATPLAFRPTLTEMETATDQLYTEVVSDFSELFENINGINQNVEFVFDHEGKELLREKMDQFVAEVNEAIRDGKVPPKSKTPELIPRIACALHVFNHAMEQLLAGVPSSQPDTMISKTTLENAASFVHHLETQKEILCQVITRNTKTSIFDSLPLSRTYH